MTPTYTVLAIIVAITLNVVGIYAIVKAFVRLVKESRQIVKENKLLESFKEEDKLLAEIHQSLDDAYERGKNSPDLVKGRK